MSVKILTYHEHYNAMLADEDAKCLTKPYYQWCFPKYHKQKDDSKPCYTLIKRNDEHHKYFLELGYFVGLDWLEVNTSAIHVTSKINSDEQEIDIIGMLFSTLKHPEVSKEIKELFIVKWEQPTIEISQKQDILTPFLVVEFLGLLKQIVRKGLKKSYYKVVQNLQGTVKGKIQVSKTIKKNLVNNKQLYTYCSFDEFGINNKENRLLKKALQFVKRYLPSYSKITNRNDIQNLVNYINPAFAGVSDQIEMTEIKQTKTNVFYKEYEQALYLAKLILKRFGYNISNTIQEKVQSPPFWIDMSKLFELYVLGLLKDEFQNEVKFQFKDFGNELDYLLTKKDSEMVIDAKYKLRYLNGIHHSDIRQVSGYARLKKVYHALHKKQGDVIDCLIIHPDQNGLENLKEVNLKKTAIEKYYDIYKIGVKLPTI
ncbi:5-methylcytosine restriction system specificity protein McrC [Kordia sp.]|uniref:5-methylcytosine restriction system specificity protein McrC n=1 Tax=Kordia sp. TaxID=1965332 RepID=UPI003B5C8519